MQSSIYRIVCIIGLLLLNACASQPRTAFYSFMFRAVDSPGVDILDYRYGSIERPVDKPLDWEIERGPLRARGIGGEYRVGEEIYVKWRVQSSNKVFEKTVDLRRRLPQDMNHKVLTFSIIEENIFIFTTAREIRPKSVPPRGPSLYDPYVVYQIYPD